MQNTSPRSLQPLIRMITPLKGARRKSIANNEIPENKREKLCDCDGDLLDVASINLEQIEFGITIEENKTQSKDNEVIQQQSNQNTIFLQSTRIKHRLNFTIVLYNLKVIIKLVRRAL